MDYYKILGVNKTSTPDEIKKAYRKLATQYHPDKGGDTAKFQEIQKAYETLSDPQKKQEYDNPMPQGMHGFPGGFQFHSHGFNFDDILGQFFGQQRPGHNHRQTFRTVVNVALDDAYKGGSHVLQLHTPHGAKVANIQIPKGVHTGQQMRYDNIIDNATLLVEFVILPHPKYNRENNDLYSQHDVSVLDLIAGGSFKFTVLSGKTFEVTIHPKTQPYTHLKISGQGMPVGDSNMFGDQYIVLKPYLPDIIDTEIVDAIVRAKNK